MQVFTAFTNRFNGNMKSELNKTSFLERNNLKAKISVSMKQQHTNKVCIVDSKYENQICDAIITQRKDVALFTLVADCQPILMYDEINEVIAAIHAGREGVFKNILKEVVQVFIHTFESNSKNIKVIIGPSAQKCCYEVGATSSEYIDYVKENFGSEFVHDKNIDLQGITFKQLLDQGIIEENITGNDICTMESDNYFSYRNGNNRNKHRFAGVIALL